MGKLVGLFLKDHPWVETDSKTAVKFMKELERELAEARAEVAALKEDAERWRAAKPLFDSGYQLENGDDAIGLFLPFEAEQCDPDAAIDAARKP